MTAMPAPIPPDLSALQQAADDADRAEASMATTCRAMWAAVKDADDDTKATVRAAIDRVLERAEDASDLAAARLAKAEYDAGEPTIPWEQVKAELADA